MKPALFTLLACLVCGPALAQQANVNLDYNPQKNTEALIPFSAPLNSPDVRDDRTVTFRLKAPEARAVSLAGVAILVALGRNAPVPFEKGADGVWSLTVGPLRPDMYIYHLVVDGVQMADPYNTVAGFTAMPPYSQLVVHGDGPAYYDARDVPHGTVTRHIYRSGVTRGERELYVYTPPGYDRSKQYPVLYLVGGSGDLPHNWVYDGRVNLIMDNLLAEGKAVPMVIAIPNNQVVHRNHPRHVELTFPTFEAELRQHVIPLVERQYRVQANPRGRALAGLSMGGRHTMFVGFKSLDLFGSFGVLSAGDVDSEKSLASFLNDPAANRKVDYLFVGQGTEEAKGRMGERCVALHDALTRHQITHEYYVGGHGGHDWATWRHLVHERFLPGLWRTAGPPAGGAPGQRPAAWPPPGWAGRLKRTLLEDIIPMVDANDRTLADQAHRAMAGLSMGGMQTNTIAMENLDVFSHIGIFSGGTVGGPATAHSGVMANATEFNKKVRLIFQSCGSRERPENVRANHEPLKAAGINSVFYVSPNTAHEWQTWRRSLHEFAPLLFGD